MKGLVLINLVARSKLNQVDNHFIDSLFYFYIYILYCNIYDSCISISHEFILIGVQANPLNFM